MHARRSRPAPDRGRAAGGAPPCRSAPGLRRSVSRFHRLRSWSSSSTMSPSASSRAGARACCSSSSAFSPMISGSLWKQAQQQPRQADRLVAQRRAHMCRAAARRIAFVEQRDRSSRRRRRAARRAPTAPGVSNGTSAAAMRRLARVMRCSIALSLDQEGARDFLAPTSRTRCATRARSAASPAGRDGSR